MNRNLSPQQFMHGTPAKLKSGDLITSAESRGAPLNNPAGNKRTAAAQGRYNHFTTDYLAARSFSYDKNENQGRVYVVEPTGKHHIDPHDRGSSRRSKHPLRVVDEI
jgi:hypothetical protein